MKILPKPQQPTNREIAKNLDIEGFTIQDLVKLCEENGVEPNEAYVNAETEHGYCGGYPKAVLLFVTKEHTDEDYADLLKKYERKLKTWEKWYAENETEILEEKRKQAAEKERIKIKSAKREKAALERSIKALENKLKKLK